MIRPVVLIILDGWGIAAPGPGNAVALAKKPNFDRIWSSFPHALLGASGEEVGLPRGENGNSETGHLNLGAGNIVFQDLPRIDLSIANGSFFQIPAFIQVINHVKKHNSSLHLLGLVGAAGVHSSIEHLFALIQLAKNNAISKLWLHLFTDGRDSPPTSADIYIRQIEEQLKVAGVGKIATLCGRYFAMDRDLRWERTKKAYELIVMGKGWSQPNPHQAIKDSYLRGKTDEFIEPVIIDKNGIINDHDGVIFFNFRIDRPRQLTKALILSDFERLAPKKVFDPYGEKYGVHQYETFSYSSTFKRERVVEDLFLVTMTEYEKNLPVKVAFPPTVVKLPLARVLAERGFRQFHISETEKERFVTYYFDGGRETLFPGEEWKEIPSPKVATYDLAPQMSAYEITKELITRIKVNLYDFIVVNYANPDMVGHTGVLGAGIKACEVVDECLGKVISLIRVVGGAAVITADHGNVEEMINLQTGEVDTEHSANPVPLIMVAEHLPFRGCQSKGILADVAPTILDIMGIKKPSLMTGRSLLY